MKRNKKIIKKRRKQGEGIGGKEIRGRKCPWCNGYRRRK